MKVLCCLSLVTQALESTCRSPGRSPAVSQETPSPVPGKLASLRPLPAERQAFSMSGGQPLKLLVPLLVTDRGYPDSEAGSQPWACLAQPGVRATHDHAPEFTPQLKRRRGRGWERLWVKNGRKIGKGGRSKDLPPPGRWEEKGVTTSIQNGRRPCDGKATLRMNGGGDGLGQLFR